MEPSVVVLRALGYDAVLTDLRLIVVADHSFRLRMLNACLGTDMMFAFAALVIAFPGKWRDRLWFLPIGYVGIELINIARVVMLSLVWLNYGTQGPIDHHDLFNLASVFLILLMFVFWVRRYNSQSSDK